MNQVNATTGVTYKNSNQFILQSIQEERGYKSNEWLTFLQARELNKKIKKGEHGVKLVRVLTYIDKENKIQKGLKKFIVFNVEQTEALA